MSEAKMRPLNAFEKLVIKILMEIAYRLLATDYRGIASLDKWTEAVDKMLEDPEAIPEKKP